MMKKRMFSCFAYVIAIAVMLSTVFVTDMTAEAEGEDVSEEVVDEEYEEDEEVDEEDEDWDEDDYAIDTVVNFRATKITKNSVTLKWDKVEDIDGYEISYKKASASKWKTIEVDSPNKVTYVVKKLSTDTKYNFRVRAYIFYEEDDEDEEDDEYIEEDIEYEEDEEEYEDDEEYEEDEEWDDYEYGEYSKMTLNTLDKKGNGVKTAASNTSEATAHKSVKTPKIKSVKSKSAGKVEVKWNKSNNATGYEVYSSVKKGSGYKRAGVLKKNNKVKYIIKNLKSGKTYFIKVRAYVKSGRNFSYTKYSTVKKIKVK